MRIIMKSYLEDYRIAVAKISFLETYGKRYFFVNNLDKTSMLVIDKEDYDRKKRISLLRKPKNLQSDYPLTIFYEKNSKRKLNKYEISANIKVLSDEFKECFQKNLRAAFLDPDNFFKDEAKNEYCKIIFAAIPGMTENYKTSEVFENYLKNLNKNLLFKYTSKDIDEIRKNYKGSLFFCHPKEFNDPFDCNCSFKNRKSAAEHFRVLCLTKEYNNILMWSHYGAEHKGYCYGYKFDELYKKIFSGNFISVEGNRTISGLVVLGDVVYTTKRPKQRLSHFQFSWADISHYISACFTKFKDWEYEKEVRFVIMSPDKFMPDFLGINLDPVECYRGCESQVNGRLSKSLTQYALY